MRLQRHGMIQTKVSANRGVGWGSEFKVHTVKATAGPKRSMWPLSLWFQEQYLFCYKVWLEVLQGILQLHGNHWQLESPKTPK